MTRTESHQKFVFSFFSKYDNENPCILKKKKKDKFPDTCNKILNPRKICMAQKCVFSIHYVCWGGGVLKHPKFMNLCAQGKNNGERIPPCNDSSLKLILAFSHSPG